ncbi:MAG: PAS domain S-box protein [Chloroflexi bacterium]|nr:PAS domain S-box protein [Chloroflexota bacterium]
MPTTIILLTVALVVFYAYQSVTQDLVVGRNEQLTRLSAGQLAAAIEDYSETLNALARNSDFYQGDAMRQIVALQQNANNLAIFDGGVIVLNPLGIVAATDNAHASLMGQNWADRGFFRQIIRRAGVTYSDILPDKIPVIAVAVPILDEQSEFRGTLVGMFSVGATGFSAFYGDIVKLRLGAGGNMYLVDSTGKVIYHTNANHIGSDVQQQPVVRLVLQRQSGSLRTRDFNDDILASYAPVPGTPWGLVNQEEWSSLLASGRDYEQFLLVLLALGVIVPTLVVTFGVKRITDPIDKLIVGAKEIAGGKFGQQISVHTRDELEELVKQFNIMSNELQASYTALKEREERLELVMRGTNDGIWDWNLLTNQIYLSPRWKNMLGYADDDMIGFDDWRDLIHPDDMEHAFAKIQSQDADPFYQMELRLRHKDGSYRCILARGIALRDAQGKPYRVAGSHTDITERKQADEAIRQSEKRFAQVFHASPIPITITALEDGRYIEVNNAWLKLFGYERDEVIGNSSLSLNIWLEPKQRATMIQQLESTGTLRDFEHLAQTKSGEVRDVLVSAEVIELNNERYNLSFVYDITELKQTQQTLERRVAERTHELATLNAIAKVASRSLDLKEILGNTLDNILRVMSMEFGAAYRIIENSGEAHHRLDPIVFRGISEELARFANSLSNQTEFFDNAVNVSVVGIPVVWKVEDAPTEIEIKRALEKEGIQLIASIPLTAKGKLVGVINLGTRAPRTITPEELSLLAAIGQQVGIAVENARLYDQAEQSAAVAERTRLARELHDSVTQSLYSVTLYAEAAAILLESGKHVDAVQHLRELRDTAQEALREMRLLIYELRPLALEKSGFAAALQARLDAVETRGGVKVEFQVEGEERLSLSVQQELYHIAQEALNNTIKHAHAHRVQVHLAFLNDCARLEICDDGAGFDPGKLHRGGLGLAGMKERAQKIGAQLEIKSELGKGTLVRVIMPTQQF